jgi:KDO2-lipid IV(A) lauroyltransferase
MLYSSFSNRKMRASPRKFHKRFKDRLGYILFKLAASGFAWLPRPVARWLGGIIGIIGWFFWRGYRRLAHVNVRIALGGELSFDQQRRLVLHAARNMAREFLELFVWLRLPEEKRRRLVDLAGVEHLRAARSGGKGVILVTAHLGNFPILSLGLTLSGFPNAFVTQQFKVESTGTYFGKLASRLGVELIDALPRSRCALECVRQLNENKAVLMALDMDARSEGIFVDFFGKPASTYSGPLVLARRTGAPVLPAFLIRQPDGRHRAFIHPPLPTPDAHSRQAEDYVEALREYNRLLESYIRKYPDQWAWTSKRWRTRPPAEVGVKLYRKGY